MKAFNLTAAPYSRTQPLRHRRATAAAFFVSLILIQLFLPSFGSERWASAWPVLLLPLLAYSQHQLTSNAWVWNRVFRKGSLDEYELHQRHAAYAEAYQTLGGWASWVLLLAAVIGSRPESLPFFPQASPEAAGVILIFGWFTLFDSLPRIMMALREDDL